MICVWRKWGRQKINYMLLPEGTVVDDLSALDDVTEETVLECIRSRYHGKHVYTYVCGESTLIAVNPYEGCNRPQDAHATIAERALREAGNHSILLSGESGAGKTVIAKSICAYFCRSSESRQAAIMECIPLLESSGHAATRLNHDASRYGKYLRIFFQGPKITKAEIVTYLLEKVRVVHQGPGERSYHLFYQAPLSTETRSEADATTWHARTEPSARTVFGDNESIIELLEVLAAVVALCQLECADIDAFNSSIQETHIVLGVEKDHLISTLTALGTADTKNTVRQASAIRDAFAMALYERLFQAIVQRCNEFMSSSAKQNNNNSRFVGLLDFFGFQDLGDANSLEQLVINYAHEKLQEQCNCHLFKHKIQEYRHEGIQIPATAFLDNAPIITAIESLWSCLEAESHMLGPTSSKDSASKLIAATDSSCVTLYEDTSQFIIHHHAGPVRYQACGFVKKNRDVMPPAVLKLAASSSRTSIRSIFSMATRSIGYDGRRRVGIVKSFSASLQALRHTLNATECHYIHCIKPNAHQSPKSFDSDFVKRQLRYMNILHIIQVRKYGYARQFAFDDFIQRYRVAITTSCGSGDTHDEYTANLQVVEQLVALWKPQENNDIIIGRSKIFLRLNAFAQLEEQRNIQMRDSVLHTIEQAETDEELEAALRLAFELNLPANHDAIDQGQRRLSALRATTIAQRLNKALNAAEMSPGLDLDTLGKRLDEACGLVSQLEIFIIDDDGSLDEVRQRLKSLRERDAALAACERASVMMAERALSGEKHLLNEAANLLAACLNELDFEVYEQAPEALAAREMLEEIRKAKQEVVITPDAHKKQSVYVHSACRDELMQKNGTEVFGAEEVVVRPTTLRLGKKNDKKVFAPPCPESLLDFREKSHARRVVRECNASSILVATESERRAFLEKGVEVIKYYGFKPRSRPSGETAWLRLEQDDIVWSHSALSSKMRAYFRSRSGIALDSIRRVSLGPDEAKPGKPSVISIIHAHGAMGVFSKWAYLTLSTETRDFIFGFLLHDNSDTKSFVRLLNWALSLELLADAARGRVKKIGDGCLARLQKRYFKIHYDRLHENERNAPLSRLCPALIPLAFFCAQTIESDSTSSECVGVSFGAKAPEEVARKASSLPLGLLETIVSTSMIQKTTLKVIATKNNNLLEGCLVSLHEDTGRYDLPLSSLNKLVRYCEHRDIQRPHYFSTDLQASNTRRAAVARNIPEKVNDSHLFAAIAKQDADLVEALVLRGPVPIDIRWKVHSQRTKGNEWRLLAGQERVYMMPTRGTTPLNYAMTWIDIFGVKTTTRLVRRICDLRADPNLDDRHTDLSFTPLAHAVLAGTIEIVALLLSAGARPELCIGDGRTPLHLLPSVNNTEARKSIFSLLMNTENSIKLLEATDPATGDTPLHLASCAGHIELCTAMLNYGADKFCMNDNHLNPADAALKHLDYIDKYDDIDNMLLQRLDTKKSNILRCVAVLKSAMRITSPRCTAPNDRRDYDSSNATEVILLQYDDDCSEMELKEEMTEANVCLHQSSVK